MHQPALPPRVRILLLASAAVLSAGSVRLEAQDGKDTRYNQETVAIMQRVMAPDANGVDVGAFKGIITKPMLRIAPRGRHIAVEPQPAYAKRLRKQFPAVQVVEAALSDGAGTAEFVLAVDAPARSGLRLTELPPGEERTRTITVPVRRLDDVVEPARPIAFIKIDVEGAEYLVLRGAAATIRRDHPVIVFEYGRAGRHEYGIEPSAMWRLLHDEYGLELNLMRDWLDGRPDLDQAGFTRIVDAGTDWMFIAHPRPTAAARQEPAR